MAINIKNSVTEYDVKTPTQRFVLGFKAYKDGAKDVVTVKLDGVDITKIGYTYKFINDNEIEVSPAVTKGTVRVRRETNLDDSFHKFTAGALFNADSMDANFTQVLHSQQEVRDEFKFVELNANGVLQEARNATALANSAVDRADKVTTRVEGVADLSNTVLQRSNSALSKLETALLNVREDAKNVVNDAINNTAVEGGILAATFVTVEEQLQGEGALNLRSYNNKMPFIVSGVADLSKVKFLLGRTVQTTSYHKGKNSGGNTYCYDSALDKSLHNGGKYIDPTKVFPTDFNDLAQQQAWFTANPTGKGLFVLQKADHDILASDFGCHSDYDSSHALQSAVNYSQYKCVIGLDCIVNTSNTLILKSGMGLKGSHYIHNSRSTLSSNIINYSGTGDGVLLTGVSDNVARVVTFDDIHVYDVLNTANSGVTAYNLIGSTLSCTVTGFANSVVIQNHMYYVNKFDVFGVDYRNYGIAIGGNINGSKVAYKLISKSETIVTGFICGTNVPALGVLASSSYAPIIFGSVEQNSGRSHVYGLVRGGDIRAYYESPSQVDNAYSSIHMIVNRCLATIVNVYGSGKSATGVYVDNSRDCKISGEIKGSTTADITTTATCVGIDVSRLYTIKASCAHYSTGNVVGMGTGGGAIRESYGANTVLPSAGGYAEGSKLWYRNPIVTETTIETGKLVITAGSFGVLAKTKVTGTVGSKNVSIDTGANNLQVGDYLNIPSNAGYFYVTNIFIAGDVAYAELSKTLSTSVTNELVTYFAPTSKPMIVTTV